MSRIGAALARAPRSMVYGLVGVLNTLVDVLVFTALIVWAGFGPVAANAAGFLAGAINSYVLNRTVTFRSASGASRWFEPAEAVRFALATAAIVALSSALIFGLARILPVAAAKAATMVATFAVGYVINRDLVFRARARPRLGRRPG